MQGFVFESKLTSLLCNSSISAEDIPEYVPYVHGAYFILCYIIGAFLLFGGCATLFALRRVYLRSRRVSNATLMLFLSTLSSWSYAAYYLLGGGVHKPHDQVTRVLSIYALYGGGLVVTLSTVLWNESKQNLMAFSALPEPKQKRRKLVLRVASLLPGFGSLLYSYSVVLMPVYSCLPVVSIFRRASVFTVMVLAIVGSLNYYYLRKSVQSLEWMRDRSSKDGVRCAQLADTIKKVKRQSGTVLLSGPPNMTFALAIVVFPVLEDVPWFYAVVMCLQAATLLGISHGTFTVFYWNKPESTVTGKSSSKVNPQKFQTEKDEVSSTGFG